MSDVMQMETENFKFFQHKECEFFPCHKVKDPSKFNCLFCYCPLYALGERCGGKFRYNEHGVKDCSACIIPHSSGGYDYVMERFGDIKKLAARQSEEEPGQEE